MKQKIIKINVFIFFSTFLITTFCNAEEQKSFFSNSQLQTILNKTYQLIDEKNDKKYPFKIEDFSYVETNYVQDPDYYSEIENIIICKDQIGIINNCDLTQNFQNSFHYRKTGKILLDQPKIINYLKEIGEKIDLEPINGKIEVSESGDVRILELSKKGYKLNSEETFDKIKNILLENYDKNEIKLVINEKEPEIKTDNVTEMGIVEIIGKGESNFAGSPKNRIHNINTGVSKFHGLILNQGEEFSFVNYLGEVNAKTGYKPELVIKNNETIPEFGGGICQVSTTMFRAALNAGFEITARKNHAYPVQYYSPQGTDATIYIPNPDLKFINNSPSKILIQGKIEGTKLFFTFYGTDDGREVSIEGPIVTKRNNKNQMWTSLSQIVKDKNGNEIINDTFKSFYDDPAKYHTDSSSSQVLTKKPKEWSKNEWSEYKKAHGI